MNLRQLKVFLAVVDTGGFTAAAERLRIAQPAVSSTIRKLEIDVGVSLLVRTRRRVSLTPEGTAFVRHARLMIDQMNASYREMAALQSLEVGQLTIGAPALVCSLLLPRVVAHFVARHPGIRLNIKLAGAEEIAARVLSGELDLGIIAAWHVPKGLATRVLQFMPMMACMASSSPLAAARRLSWARLLEQKLILFPRGYYQRARVEDAATRLGRTLDVRLETESVPVMLEMVRRGHGVATLLAGAVPPEPGMTVLPLPRDARVPIAICRRLNAALPRAATYFEDCIVGELAG